MTTTQHKIRLQFQIRFPNTRYHILSHKPRRKRCQNRKFISTTKKSSLPALAKGISESRTTLVSSFNPRSSKKMHSNDCHQVFSVSITRIDITGSSRYYQNQQSKNSGLRIERHKDMNNYSIVASLVIYENNSSNFKLPTTKAT